MANSVSLNLLVDAAVDGAVAAFDEVGQHAQGMADDVTKSAKDADSGMSGFGDSAEGAGSSAATAAGAFGDLGGALGMLPGPLGALGASMETAAPAIQGVTGATDLLGLAMESKIVTTVRDTAVTIAQTTASIAANAATKVWAATQWLLNAALSANPIGLVVIAIALLIGGLILAYEKSDSFRAIVDKLGEVAKRVFDDIVALIKDVISWVADHLGPAFTAVKAVISTQIDLITGFIDGILTAVKSVADKIFAPLDTAWGKVKGLFDWDPTNVITKAWSGIKAIIVKPFDDAWTVISGIFVGADSKMAGIGGAAVTAITNMANDVIDIINKLINAFNKLPGPNIPNVPHVGSNSVSGSATATTTAGVSSSSRSVGGVPVAAAGGGTTINIYGAIDPYQTAQQIRRILARGAVISGRATP